MFTSGKDRSAQCRKKETLELHGLGHVGQLNVVQTGNDNQQPKHPEDGHIALFAVQCRNGGCRKEQTEIKQYAEGQVKEEDRRIIQIIRVLFLDQGVGHSAVGENLQNIDNRQHHRDLPRWSRTELPRENNAYDDVEQLCAETLKEAPEEVAGDLATVTHAVCQSS